MAKGHADSSRAAVLRMDANFYDSYADVLYTMYEDISVGGIVIFDDVYPSQFFYRSASATVLAFPREAGTGRLRLP